MQGSQTMTVPSAQDRKPDQATADDQVHQGKRNRVSHKKRLGQIYALPLPVECHPLPAFIPHNPLSLLRIVHAVCVGYFRQPLSHPRPLYTGIYSQETQSVHITDPLFIRALWEKGFFGKGSLSRSDPSWLDREMRKQGLIAQQSSEEVTQNRRAERRQMKFERALQQREAIDKQLQDEGKAVASLDGETAKDGSTVKSTADLSTAEKLHVQTATHLGNGSSKPNFMPLLEMPTAPGPRRSEAGKLYPPQEVAAQHIETQEHLELLPEEAFFLSFGIGALEIYDETSQAPLKITDMFQKFRQNSYSPAISASSLLPDDPFLLKYVVYHHFRSLGWNPRGGSKFSVDFMLYHRGPVFSHAEYAVAIVPSYSHPYWSHPSRRAQVQSKESYEWHWLHCVNRVQAHVHKSLVLVYVDIPPPLVNGPEINVGKFLQRYKAREFVVRRWLMNRSRG